LYARNGEDYSLKVELAQKGHRIEITASGDIDLYSSPVLRKTILDAANHKAREIRIVLASVGYMDSSGVATLVEGLRAAKDSGKAFRLQSPSQPVMKVLQLARLDTIFSILPDGD